MLTVLIATRNGATTLPAALEACCRLMQPAGGWKLVVVDNASTDGTDGVLRAFSQRLPLCRLHEPVPGKNAALNTGLAEIEGDLVVFTDDDTLPHPHWLAELRRAADSQPAYSVFGGPVLAHWQTTPAPWLLDWVRQGTAFGLTDPTLAEGEVAAASLFGANMAIRADVFAAGFRFDPSVGPCGDDYPMGSETELNERLERHGRRSWYRSSAVVEHVIRDFQLDPRWILHRAELAGRGAYHRQFANRTPPGVALLGIRSFLIRHTVQEVGNVIGTWLRGDRRRCWEARWRLRYVVGQAVESRTMAKSRARGGRNPRLLRML